MMKLNKLYVLVLLLILTECCLVGDLIGKKTTTTTTTSIVEVTTTRIMRNVTFTIPPTTSTIPPTTTTPPTTSTIPPTSTILTPTTIAGARCYMNSDCGPTSVSYYCKMELVEGAIQPTTKGYAVYKVTYIPICKSPGTPWAACETIRRETSWDGCAEWEQCINGCHTCVPKGGTCPAS